MPNRKLTLSKSHWRGFPSRRGVFLGAQSRWLTTSQFLEHGILDAGGIAGTPESQAALWGLPLIMRQGWCEDKGPKEDIPFKVLLRERYDPVVWSLADMVDSKINCASFTPDCERSPGCLLSSPAEDLKPAQLEVREGHYCFIPFSLSVPHPRHLCTPLTPIPHLSSSYRIS